MCLPKLFYKLLFSYGMHRQALDVTLCWTPSMVHLHHQYLFCLFDRIKCMRPVSRAGSLVFQERPVWGGVPAVACFNSPSPDFCMHDSCRWWASLLEPT